MISILIKLILAVLLVLFVTLTVYAFQYFYRLLKIPKDEYKNFRKNLKNGKKVTYEDFFKVFRRR